jgi:hypothetical protein
MSADFRDEHDRMGTLLRQSLVSAKLSVASAVTALRNEFSKERKAFNRTHHQMSRQQRKALLKDRLERSHAVEKLMTSFSKSHHLMAKTQRTSLLKGRQTRSQDVVALMRSFHARSVVVPSVAVPVLKPLKALVKPAVQASMPVQAAVLATLTAPVQALAQAPVQALVQAAVQTAVETRIKEPLSSFNWSQAMQTKSAPAAVVPVKQEPSLFVDPVAEVVVALKQVRTPESVKVEAPRAAAPRAVAFKAVPAKTVAGKSKKK